jgi:hypothetical protein
LSASIWALRLNAFSIPSPTAAAVRGASSRWWRKSTMPESVTTPSFTVASTSSGTSTFHESAFSTVPRSSASSRRCSVINFT